MNIDHEVRRKVMAGSVESIRHLFLNRSQVGIVKMVGQANVMTASELSEKLEVSIQNASSKLNRLFTSGYLERVQMAADSGGIEYVYRAQVYGG